MNSEKAKEIKETIQETIDGKLSNKYLTICEISCCPRLDIDKLFADTLTLINELESENKDYKDRCELIHDLGFDYDGSKTIEDFKILVDELVLVAINGAQVKKGIDNKLKTENQQLKDRIAELEEGIAKSMLGCEFLPECTNEKLKQFAERLRYKLGDYDTIRDYVMHELIDETLKEFINK